MLVIILKNIIATNLTKFDNFFWHFLFLANFYTFLFRFVVSYYIVSNENKCRL